MHKYIKIAEIRWDFCSLKKTKMSDDPTEAHHRCLRGRLVQHQNVMLIKIFVSCTLWWTNILPWKMAIEIVEFPIKNGDFPLQNVSSPEGILN